MADINTSRKRKNSECDAIPDVSADNTINDNGAEEKVDKVSVEPALKCPRKSDLVEPNLQDKEQIENVTVEVAAAGENNEDKTSNELSEDGTVNALSEDKTVNAISEDKTVNTLNEDEIVNALSEDGIVNALNEDRIVNALSEDGIVNALNEDGIVNALSGDRTDNALNKDETVNSLSEDVTVNALSVDGSVKTTDNSSESKSNQNSSILIAEDKTKVTKESEAIENMTNLVVEEPPIEDEKTISAETTNDAVITISFLNSDVFDKYKISFYEHINKFREFDAKTVDNSIIITKRENIKLSEWLLIDSKNQSESDVESTSTKSRKKKYKPKSKKELFMVDTTPSGDQTNAPKYSSKFKVLGLDPEEVEQAQSTPTCFNCDGSHTLKDCPEPKNFAKIRAARFKFRPNLGKAPRYHLEDDQKFAHLQPGQLSEKLRTALGLGKYQVPSHVYKMRIMGYPPGWLEEAKFVHSNIDLFDIEGKNIKQKRTVQGIDPEKVIAYPGFNVKADRGFRDECNYYNVPPFSENHSKNAMIDFYNQLHLLQNPKGASEDDLETCDMEIDEKEEIHTPKPLTKTVYNRLKFQESETSRLSPTLRDLEIQKKQLLEELNDQDTDNSMSNDLASAAKENNENTPNSLVKTTVFGTPILKSTSPYARLPKTDNFSKDISPLLNFENLPNSTGKYEQMTNVLEKVRKTLKDLQEKT